MSVKIKIKNHMIGTGYPCFIVAEIGINHNGHVEWAMDMIREAKQAGANAIKIQSFKTEDFMHKDNPEFNSIKSLELTYADQEKLFKFAKREGIIIFSTPEDYESVNFLEKMNVPVYKVASMDMDYYPFVEYIAKKRKPIILSTGMASMRDIRETLRVIYKTRNRNVILTHCVSSYPTQPEDVNLKAILTMKKEFNLPVGFSDHTVGISIPLAAVALGADLIEKHFTLDKKLPGDDHICSADPSDLRNFVEAAKGIQLSLGDGIKKPCKRERSSIKFKKRGLYAKTMIKKGDILSIKNLDFLCPSEGIFVSDLFRVIGKRAKADIEPDSPIKWRHIN